MLQGPIRVEFGTVFPSGAYAAGKFEMMRDFDRSQGDRVVQQLEQGHRAAAVGYRGDRRRRGRPQLTVKVKVAAEYQPVLPPAAAGSPFTAVEFEGLMVTPYVDASRCQGNSKGKDKCGARQA